MSDVGLVQCSILTGRENSAFNVRRKVLGCLSLDEGEREGGLRCAMSREGKGRGGGRRERWRWRKEKEGGRSAQENEDSEGFRVNEKRVQWMAGHTKRR
jgi:hypothetical protein